MDDVIQCTVLGMAFLTLSATEVMQPPQRLQSRGFKLLLFHIVRNNDCGEPFQGGPNYHDTPRPIFAEGGVLGLGTKLGVVLNCTRLTSRTSRSYRLIWSAHVLLGQATVRFINRDAKILRPLRRHTSPEFGGTVGLQFRDNRCAWTSLGRGPNNMSVMCVLFLCSRLLTCALHPTPPRCCWPRLRERRKLHCCRGSR